MPKIDLTEKEYKLICAALGVAEREEWVLYNDNIKDMPTDKGIRGARIWALRYNKAKVSLERKWNGANRERSGRSDIREERTDSDDPRRGPENPNG